jgi:hypothetical protein
LNKRNIFPSYLLLLLIIPLISLIPLNDRTARSQNTLEKMTEVEVGVFASGKLAYVSNGKDLGSESYELKKLETGEVSLTSEGVVTPPIPIPFVKPKIKFDQEITVGSDLDPIELSLNYDGPLGIGSSKIRATVGDGRIDADLGGTEKEGKLKSNVAFFQGTGGSQALTALILTRSNGSGKFTEIRTGGTGPQSGDEDRLQVVLELVRKGTQELKVNGSLQEVDRYVLDDPGSNVDKVILSKEGTFIAYLRLGGENSFYVYRTDLLGEDYDFPSVNGQD